MKAEACNLIPRIDLHEMSPQEFRALESAGPEFPMVLRNVWDHEEKDREAWCEELVTQLSGTDVEFQLQKPTGSFLLKGGFEDFLECVFDSHHNASYLLFDENVLADHAPSLMDALQLPVDYFGQDLFPLFPEPLRPKDSCLVAGGRGSRSKLHADPFEWVGWNYCFEGSKVPPLPPDLPPAR